VILLVAIGRCIVVLHGVRDIRSRLTVEVTKAWNKLGEVFGALIIALKITKFTDLK